jgi:hypothetical protein
METANANRDRPCGLLQVLKFAIQKSPFDGPAKAVCAGLGTPQIDELKHRTALGEAELESLVHELSLSLSMLARGLPMRSLNQVRRPVSNLRGTSEPDVVGQARFWLVYD